MKTKIKRILSVFLALTVLCSAFCAGMIQAGATESIFKGNCGANGNNLVYTLYSDRIIVIDGNGQMANYTASGTTAAPWKQLGINRMAPKAAIAHGVTSIGNYAFYECDPMHWIDLPVTLTSIGEYAFANLHNLRELTIPENVTTIGANALSNCSLTDLNLYPAYSPELNIGNIGLTESTTIHVLSQNLEAYEQAYPKNAFPNLVFVGDLNVFVAPPDNANIFYIDNDVSSGVFGGLKAFNFLALPNGEGKNPSTITNSSDGFVSCVRIKNNNGGFDYYGLESHNNGELYKISLDPTGKYVTGFDKNSKLSGLTLRLGFEYIGTNAVKVTYIAQNESNNAISFKMGTAGDIQIGSDDQAAIAPLTNDNRQIGITMTTSKNSTMDKDSNGNSLTLGFVAKEVNGSTSDAKFFYGQVNQSVDTAATGVRADKFYPSRVFEMNNNSYSIGSFSGADSGLSYYWDVTLPANQTKEYSVIFSVLGTNNENKDEAVIEKVNEGTSESSKNIGVEEDFFVPAHTKVYFDDEIPVSNGDTLASDNNYSTLRNFLLLGVQTKKEDYDSQGSKNMRFVSVAKTGLLAYADEYGYLIAKTSRSYEEARSNIDQLKYESPNVARVDCKGTSNTLNGDFGTYEEHNEYDTYTTPYKYVTLALDEVPENITVMARFYIRQGNKVYYADYYNKDKDKFDGCASAWANLAYA
ncbi:MAG: leucine-rich repeat domain-containing protein [Ruminococcus sp.]|nr:leucine-rich repeat domain-containing protein [Ruminococcus sp.]